MGIAHVYEGGSIWECKCSVWMVESYVKKTQPCSTRRVPGDESSSSLATCQKDLIIPPVPGLQVNIANYAMDIHRIDASVLQVYPSAADIPIPFLLPIDAADVAAVPAGFLAGLAAGRVLAPPSATLKRFQACASQS